jgi:AsmA protein
MDGIKISKLLSDEEGDSIPEFYNGKMYGSLFLELQFANDTTQIKLLNINKGDIDYFYGEDSIQIKSLVFNSEGIDFKLERNPNPLATLYSKGFVKADELKTNNFRVNDFNFNYFSKNGEYEFDTKLVKFFGDNSRGAGKYILKPFIENPAYRIQFDIARFDIKEMLNTFLEDTVVTGNMALSMDIAMNGNNWDEMVSTMKGHLNLTGKNLLMYGMDADKVIAEFQRSQNFNLVDAGAVLLAGPVGLAITKGTDFAKILITNPGQSSHITQLVSNWNVKDGLLMLEDVALSTNKNRLAAKGWINVVNDSLNISFAVVDDNGCSIFTQDVYGDLNKPTLGKVKVVSALLAPVTNLYNSIMSVNCQVFYNGLVKPPTKK